MVYLVLGLIGGLALLLLAYLLDLHWRPATNMGGLNCGLGARSQQKYRDQNRELWPLATNLCRTEVGGPGLLLHFNFLAVVSEQHWISLIGAYLLQASFEVCTGMVGIENLLDCSMALQPKLPSVGLMTFTAKVVIWAVALGIGWVLLAYMVSWFKLSQHGGSPLSCRLLESASMTWQ